MIPAKIHPDDTALRESKGYVESILTKKIRKLNGNFASDRKEDICILLSLRYHQTISETQIGYSVRNTDRRIQEAQDEQNLTTVVIKRSPPIQKTATINGLGVLVWVRDTVSVPQYCS